MLNSSRLCSRLVLRPVLLLVAATALAFAAAGSAGAASRAATYNDPAGDSGTAPDITAVQVSDDGSGRITFQAQTPSTDQLGQGQWVALFVDADNNRGTGAAKYAGAEYLFTRDATGWGFARWNGSDWDETAPSSTARSSYAGGAYFSIDRTELGGTSAFTFWLMAVDGDKWAMGHFDEAPDG